MARITVEDCEKFVENRFELVVIAAQRARQIFTGDKVTIKIDEKKLEKKPVIALREIAENTLSLDKLREQIIDKFRTLSDKEEEIDEDLDELMEEDTYHPYTSLEMKADEKEVENIEEESSEEDEDIEEPDNLDAGEVDTEQ